MLGSAGYERVESGKEDQLLKAVRQRGPIATMFSITPDFISYRDGIYTGSSSCAPGVGMNHALVIVGFGSENGIDYWLVQNSWGTSWG